MIVISGGNVDPALFAADARRMSGALLSIMMLAAFALVVGRRSVLLRAGREQEQGDSDAGRGAACCSATC